MCYAYIPEVNKRGKLSNKAEKLRFIGYSLQTKGYHLFDKGTSKILVCRDVIFNESDFKYGSSKTKNNDEITASHDQVDMCLTTRVYINIIIAKWRVQNSRSESILFITLCM